MIEVVIENRDYYLSGYRIHNKGLYLVNGVPVTVKQEDSEYYIRGIKINSHKKRKQYNRLFKKSC